MGQAVERTTLRQEEHMKSNFLAGLLMVSSAAVAAPSLQCQMSYDTFNTGLQSASVAGKKAALNVSTGKDAAKTTEATVSDDNFAIKAKYTSNVWFGPAGGEPKPTGKDQMKVELEMKDKKWTLHLEEKQIKPGFYRWFTVLTGDLGRQVDTDGKAFTAKRVFLQCDVD